MGAPGIQNAPLGESQRLLRAVKQDAGTASAWESIENWERTELARLPAEARRATWLNVYNAAAQDLLRGNPDRLEGTISRTLFFARETVTVAGHAVSLNDIEHGFLRGRTSWGLGYVPRLLAGRFERAVRVPLDPRIHFALNCGAASCPPIAAYSTAVDSELDLATRSYLDNHVSYDPDTGRVVVPRIFRWYRGDFGGTTGIREFLRRQEAIPSDAEPTLTYNEYDWSPDVGHFRA
ncbi:MAG: DUF547 domain-containing protein [Halobacteriaceae archaeon]